MCVLETPEWNNRVLALNFKKTENGLENGISSGTLED